MNLLAAIAIGFLVLDPEQMFEPSFQLSFLAVGFIGAFARPLLDATTLPLARALAGLDDVGRDLHLAPRAAQFRVELRLLAETMRTVDAPARSAPPAGFDGPAAGGILRLRPGGDIRRVQIGLALPMIVYFHRIGFSGLSANALVVPLFECWCRSASWRSSRAGLGRPRSAVGSWPSRARRSAGTPRSNRTGASRRRRYGWRVALAAALIADGHRCAGCWKAATGAVVAALLMLLLLASVRAGRHAAPTRADRDRRRPGRQPAGFFPRRQTDGGGWRRHPRLRPAAPRRKWISARMLSRPTCGTAPFAT